MPAYTSSSKVEHAHTDVLVVHCSDHRFVAGLQDFLNQGLNLRSNYDLLVLPGGPQCLTLVEYLPKFSWAGMKWFRFLVDAHELKRLILIAHQDCGWYKELPLHLHTTSDPRRRQEEDLHRARTVLNKEFPDMRVDLYYAGWDSSDRVIVEPV
ncbi:MAG: hypothetical protein ACE145_21330 [Terriglobia bacterium]